MPSKMYPKQDLLDLINEESEKLELISSEQAGHSRWSLHYEVIFKDGEKFFSVRYSVGATEQQDESPWQYDGDFVECWEVVPQEKVITIYARVAK